MANIHTQQYKQYHEKIAKLFEEGYKDNEIAQIIPVPIKSIQRIRYKLGLRVRDNSDKIKKQYYDIDQEALFLITEQEYSINCAAKQLGIDASSLSNRLKRFYNLEVLIDGKKHINSNFFTKVDNEIKAYWLGFIAADGYIGKNNEIEIALQERDRNHLEKFKRDINSNHKIGTKCVTRNGKVFRANRISIKDTQLAQALQRLGVINAKSCIVEMPDLPSLEMYRHFLRGYFDGNGSVVYQQGYIGFEYCTGSYTLARSIQDHAKEIVKVKSTLSQYGEHNYQLRSTSRDEGFRYLEFLYHDSTVYLDRKYEKYQTICRAKSILSETSYDEDGIKRGWRNVQ